MAGKSTNVPGQPKVKPFALTQLPGDDVLSRAQKALGQLQDSDLSAGGAVQASAPDGVDIDQYRMPVQVDPAIVSQAQSAMNRLHVLQGLGGMKMATPGGIKRGMGFGQMPGGPVWAGVQGDTMQPLMDAQLRADQANRANAAINGFVKQHTDADAQDRATAWNTAAGQAAAAAAAKAQQQHMDELKLLLGAHSGDVEAHENAATGREQIKASSAAGRAGAKAAIDADKPPGTADQNQVPLLRASADNLATVGEMLARHGSFAALQSKLGPLARGISAIAPGALSPAQKSLMADYQRYAGALDSLKATAAMATEPRRVAQELQNKLNEQFGALGQDNQVAREMLGRVAAHFARNYRAKITAHPGYWGKQRMPTPDDFDASVSKNFIMPPSWQNDQRFAPADAGAAQGAGTGPGAPAKPTMSKEEFFKSLRGE